MDRSLWLVLAILCNCTVTARLTAEDAAQSADAQPTREALDFFESKVRPLLHARCVECHSDADPESELSLESREGLLRGGKLGVAVVPGKPKESLLISAVNHDEFLKMPPKEKLTTVELGLLSKWVAMGAPWPEPNSSAKKPIEAAKADSEPEPASRAFTPEQRSFWAYQPVRQPDLPKLDHRQGARSPIDLFVMEKLRAKGLFPSSPATKQVLIRRATYDLLGLPPTEDEIKQFIQDDSPDAFERVVDRLLASPRYGERWGRHWLDVARFADSNGLDENIAYANAFRYRDYVIDALNDDKPYDRFVQEQIAGDLLAGDAYDKYVATGFLTIGAKMLAEDDPVKMQMDIIDEQLSTLCQAFMGMTIGCARCHDHKFDPLTADDYYALAGIFKSTQTMENHKVVAKWFERPLASENELQVIRAIDRQLADIKTSVDKLNKECKARVTGEIRNSIANALMATVQMDAFSRSSHVQQARGLEPSDKPYPVSEGYALIEAEGFQRGTAHRDTDSLGKGIGVIVGQGRADAEYDLDVEHAGRYAIELRYASENRRSVRILLDGIEVQSASTFEATNDGQPASQTWFVSTFVKLSPGKHVLRFESGREFPLIDKIAVVLQTVEPWSFGTAPMALSRVGVDMGVSYPVASMWREFLDGIRKRRRDPSDVGTFFTPWFQFRELRDGFESAGQVALAAIERDARFKSTSSKLVDALRTANPKSLPDVAAVYQQVIQEILASDPKSIQQPELAKLREELLSKASPLTGPANEFERFYVANESARADELDKALKEAQDRRPNPPMAMGAAESKPEDLKIHIRGSHIVLGKVVHRRFPKVLSNSDPLPVGPSGSGRLELAKWVTHASHPLTSRVMVNRIWHWHFGRGIVVSVDNFGLLGQKPTHPELLDWLANRFVAGDWSIKQLHRTIMLSQTYQTSTQFQQTASEVDPENEWLWRFRRRRLSAEETRDSIIAVGAGLDRSMYGTLMAIENHKYVNNVGGAGAVSYASARRSIYLPVIRSGVFDVLQTLDFPDPAMINGERQTSTVAPQALLMMNSDLVREQSLALAEQLMKAASNDDQRIELAYRSILKRSPSADEAVAAAKFLLNFGNHHKVITDDKQSATLATSEVDFLQSLCRVLISSNEFSYIE